MSKEIAEKIAITVYGTDNRGEMFVEDTTTAVLAHEWIKLVLRKRMTPGSEIIVFNKTNGNQAEFSPGRGRCHGTIPGALEGSGRQYLGNGFWPSAGAGGRYPEPRSSGLANAAVRRNRCRSIPKSKRRP